MKTIAVMLNVVVLASCGPVSTEDSVIRQVVGSLVNCNSDLSLCMKEHALKAVERLGTAKKLKIFDGITLLNSNPKEGKSLELSVDLDERKKQVSERLWQSASDVLQSTELELSYGGSDESDESRAISDDVGESRKKKKQLKKKLKMIIPLILLAKAKAVALVVFSLIVIAISVFKLALLAKIAFIIKVISLVKELLAKKGGQDEGWQAQGWETHAEHHPVAVEHGHGWDGGWSRTKNDANSMAYSAYGI